jgi:hypothetical protein
MDASVQSKDEGDRPRARNRSANAAELHPQIRAWLRRVAMLHAHLQWLVRLFRRPETAGGQSLQGEDFAARAAAGDRSLIFDALTFLGDQIADLRQEIANEMANTPPTTAIPGSAEKVAVMFARAEAGYDLFIDGDAKVDVS